METLNLLELQEVDTRKAFDAFSVYFGNTNDFHIKSIISSYVMYKIQAGVTCGNFNEFLKKVDFDDAIKNIIMEYGMECWDVIESNLSKFTIKELLAFILYDNSFDNLRNSEISTPKGILELANGILDVKNDDNVLELCSGKGNFLVQMATSGTIANYIGVELNQKQMAISILRASIITDKYNYILQDALEYKTENKADKIFSNYPFMVKSPAINEHKRELIAEGKISSDIINKASSDWLYNISIVEQLKETGKAVVIMTNGSTWNEREQGVRRYFVENGYIEAVISLPPRLFSTTQIPVSMIVLSKNNKEIRFVDAKDLFLPERIKNILTKEHIEQIFYMLNHDTEISVTKTIDDLLENDFVLNATRYVEVLPTFKNGVEFGTIIKSITRGSQLKAAYLDEYISSSPTNYQYLQLSNINNGVISLENTDQYLKEIPDNIKKYCVKNNSIVLSKIATSIFKSAVVQIDEGTEIVANGNLFVIELDESKVNPFYLQSFFTSELGIATFKNVYTGVTLPTLTLDKLKKMIIPLPSLEKQNEIGHKYAACLDELVFLNRKIKKVKNRLNHIFDEGD